MLFHILGKLIQDRMPLKSRQNKNGKERTNERKKLIGHKNATVTETAVT